VGGRGGAREGGKGGRGREGEGVIGATVYTLHYKVNTASPIIADDLHAAPHISCDC
jgi:hypothetical protein